MYFMYKLLTKHNSNELIIPPAGEEKRGYTPNSVSPQEADKAYKMAQEADMKAKTAALLSQQAKGPPVGSEHATGGKDPDEEVVKITKICMKYT